MAGITKDKRAASGKEALEISCSACNARFRLWLPSDQMAEWEKGSSISCIRCGAKYAVKKTARGFNVSASKEAPLREKVAEKAFEASAPEAPEAPRAPARPVRQKAEEKAEKTAEAVLLIDDDRLAREMMEHTLEDTGMRLITAKNGPEALKILRNEEIDLIVTDLYLKNPDDPESRIDGEELLKKAQSMGLSLPSIVTTGKDIIDDLVLDPKWFDLQVKGFIQKGNPFWVEELKLKIKEVMFKG